MSWATRRRLVIFLILGAVVAAFIAVVLIATLYQTPTCSDGTQNQDEAGIDCGGSCAFLCTAQVQPPTILFTKALTNAAGRTDVIASVVNKNTNAAAKNVPYRITLYGADQSILQTTAGSLDLPPNATVPVYVPGVSVGKQAVATAFLSIDPSAPKWVRMERDPRIVPRVANTVLKGSTDAPRVETVIENATVTALRNIRLIITVRDQAGTIIGASQTVVPALLPQSQAGATFTWNNAFSATPATLDVTPLIPLP